MQTNKKTSENNEETKEKENNETINIKFHGTNYIYQKQQQNINNNKTIICIHGIGGHSGLFADFASYFLNLDYNVLRYDLIGRGHSDYPSDNKFDAESHLKQLRDLIVHLGLHETKYIILGHSMGGCLASLYTNKFSEELPTIFDASYECLLQFPLSNLEEDVTSLSLNPTLPILLMWGKKDAIVPHDPNFMKWVKLLELKDKLLACTLYDELGHDFFREDPEKVFSDIHIFLQHFVK